MVCSHSTMFLSKYPGADENVLEDITFTAKPGETTAIIGSTGKRKKSNACQSDPPFFMM